MTKQVIQTDLLMRPIAHFSHAARVGGTIHVGATAGTDPERRLAGATPGLVDAGEQTRAMLDNLEKVLDLLGAAPRNLARVKLYVTDVRDMAECSAMFDQRYATQGLRPVVVGSVGFPLPQAAVELDAVAWLEPPTLSVSRGSSFACGSVERCHVVAQPIDASGARVAGGAQAQVGALIANLQYLTAAAGMSLRDLVSLHVTVTDLRYLDLVVLELARVLRTPGPATTAVVAPLQHEAMTMQLEALYVRGGGTPIEAPNSPAPWDFASAAMLAGDELHIAGQTGVVGSPLLDAAEQTLRAWERVARLLDVAGMDARHIVRTNNVLADWRDYGAFNVGYGKSVSSPHPPRTTVVGGIPVSSARMQIEAIAHRRQEEVVIVDRSLD